MNRLYLFIAFILTFGCVIQKGQAQDIHYSHITFSPIYTNPAFTGYFNGNLRLYANYRNQFLSILGSSAFQTYSGSADVNIPVGVYGKDFIGGGVNVFHDKVGKENDGGQFVTTNFGLSGSYSKSLSKSGDNALTIGISAAFLQRRFIGDAIFFGSQFNPIDPENPIVNLPPEEFVGGKLNYLNFDFSIGLLYMGKLSKSTSLYAGFTLAHLLQPRWSFIDTDEGNLPIRYGGQLGFSIKTSKKLEISPFVFYQHQGKIGEAILGNLVDFRIIEDKGFETDLLFGTYFRTLSSPLKAISFESAIILIGVDYTDLRLAFSYDVQFGGLRDIAKTNSAFEVSLKYTLGFINQKTITRICPSF